MQTVGIVKKPINMEGFIFDLDRLELERQKERYAWLQRVLFVLVGVSLLAGVWLLLSLRRQLALKRESEDKYRNLFELESDALFLIDSQNGQILDANFAAVALYGYSRDEVLGMHYAELAALPEETAKDFGQIGSGEVEKIPLRYHRKKNGLVFPVEINATSLVLQGRSVHIPAIRDITERKAAEEVLQERAGRLDALNQEMTRTMRLKDEFLACMSHELRTPLTAVIGFAELLRNGVYGEVNAEQAEAHENIENSARHLLDIINDILDLSKLEAGQVELKVEECSAEEIVQESLTFIKTQAHRKSLTIQSDVTPVPVRLQADARRLKQMLINLLSNAVKFTPEGGRIGLSARSDPGDEAVFFTVKDTGIGISAEDLCKLFQPFVQLDGSLCRKYGGTGLGLVLVKRTAQLHGGELTVKSAPGEGSEFTIRLPWNQSKGR